MKNRGAEEGDGRELRATGRVRWASVACVPAQSEAKSEASVEPLGSPAQLLMTAVVFYDDPRE
jgi:hypothetical protein